MDEKKRGLSRRDFITSAAGAAAATAALGLVGCGKNATAAVTGLPSKWDKEADVVVVGGGGGGMVAATKAKELGASVILLEKAAIVGGDTAISSQCAQGLWKARIVEGDSIDVYIEDLKNSHWATEKGQGKEDLPKEFPLTRAWLETCSDMYEWTEKNGMEWADVNTVHQAWYPQPQWDTKPLRQWAPKGGSITAVMQKLADKLGVEIMTSTPVYDLIVNDGGRVVGVRAIDSEDKPISVKAKKAVILACGGFNANRGMMTRYLPKQGRGYCGGCDGNTGDGHMMVKAIGGKLKEMHLGTHWMVYDDVSNTTLYNGAVMAYGGTASLADAADYPFILVNFEGKRFMAETMGYKWTGYYTNNQPYHMNFFVFDSGEACSAWFKAAADRFGGEEKAGLKVYRAQSLEELAADMQVPPAELVATVQRYNGFVDADKDDEFGRSMRKVAKLETAPFCAIRMRPRHYTTYGGIAIDPEGHVLNEKDEAIAGLYAAGTCCGALVEQEGLYYQGGVGQTMTFGYLTATKAVKEEAWE
ncbi:MAG: FAD-dependent oxidoreductase [Coriobacteriia bacterium]